MKQATKPKLSILIATVGERDDRFKRLIACLRPQVQRYHGQVEVLVHWNNFETTIGDIRQDLVHEARGEYVCFIDDDDLVPHYYIDRIMEALKGDYDFIGWRMQVWMNGEKMKPTFHSTEYKTWSDNQNGYYRNVSHLNPIKRSIALLGSFVNRNGTAEDFPWAQEVFPYIKTEYYIDSCMYYYYSNSEDSVWGGKDRPKQDYIRPPLGDYFRYHPNSEVIYCAHPR